ncbi:MAG: hypothetical protein J5640_01520 [Bacteroidales bacterium]|nr:hypothetical protein [Bacteroidales bacterium]
MGLLALCSCERGSREYLAALDRAIEMKPVYDSLYVSRQDSLRRLFLDAGSDSLKWERAYEIEKVLFYHDVDSCHRYVREMLRLSGDDPRRRGLSQSCYANILFKLDSLTIARNVLEKIDTTGFDSEAFGIYAFAGHHIYGKLKQQHPEFEQVREELIERWWQRDSSAIECAYYHNTALNNAGLYDQAIEKLLACELKTPNDTTKANYFLALEYSLKGDEEMAVRHFARSATFDMRLSVKAYRSLYELARLLFRQGDIRRADRYMRMAHQDAIDSHYAVQYEDIVRSLLEIMNVLLQQEQQKKQAYLLLALVSAMLLAVALVSLFLLNKYSRRLDRSRKQINEISQIKDGFLAHYMEKCVDYLNNVDRYRSSLRQTARNEGYSGVLAMLRKPSFADDEFHDLLSAFDTTFLGIFPDFVERVNEHMQPEHRLSRTAGGELSTELRILALIRMGIPQRRKIAKVLNMSVTTVYSYHSLLQKHSLHPDASFDRIIASL